MFTIGNAVAATRVVVHGPPPATPDSAEISKAAMTILIALNFLHWRLGATSNTLMKVESQSWLGIGNHVSHD